MNRTTTLLAAGVIACVAMTGCKGKKKQQDMVQEAAVVEEERPNFGTAEDQLKRAEEAAAGDTPEAKAADPEIPWGKKVKDLSRNLAATLINCNDKYFKALKPDELLVGKPALVTTDGVVTVMAEACDSIKDDLDLGLALLDGMHPSSTQLLRQWTLLADMYVRVSKSAINAGAKPKRRKLNHGEMVVLLPIMTKELIPGLVKTLTPLMKIEESATAQEPGAAFEKVTAANALATWTKTIEDAQADLLALEAEYVGKAYEPLMGDLYPRRRYLKWLDGYWTKRLALEKKQVARTSTGDSAFDDKLRGAVGEYHAAAEAYLAASWKLGLEAIADKSMIDEEKLKTAKAAFKKAGKTLERSLKKIKLPKA